MRIVYVWLTGAVVVEVQDIVLAPSQTGITHTFKIMRN